MRHRTMATAVMGQVRTYLDAKWAQVKDLPQSPEHLAIGNARYLWGNYQNQPVVNWLAAMQRAQQRTEKATLAYPDPVWRRTCVATYQRLIQYVQNTYHDPLHEEERGEV